MKLKNALSVLDAKQYGITNHNGSRTIYYTEKEDLAGWAEYEILYITPSGKPGTLEIWLAV